MSSCMYSVKMRNHILKLFLLIIHTILVFPYKTLWQYSFRRGSLTGAEMAIFNNVWLWNRWLLERRVSSTVSIYNWAYFQLLDLESNYD